MRLLFLILFLSVLTYTFADSDGLTATRLKEIMIKSKKFAFKTLKSLLEHHELLIFKGIEFIKFMSDLKSDADFDSTNLEHQFSRINQKLDKISEDLKVMQNELLTAHENYADIAYLEAQLTTFYNHIGVINDRFSTFSDDLTNPNKTFLKHKYESFNEKVLEEGSDGINEILTDIHKVLLSTNVRPQNVFSYIAEMRLKKVTMCMRLQSPQQYIYDLMEIAIAAETKGLMLIISAIDYEKQKEKLAETDDIQRAKERFQTRATNIFNQAIKFGSQASRDIWRCDPRNAVKGVTYAAIGPLFQKYIMHENDGIGNKCFESCPQGTFINKTYIKCTSDFCLPLRDTRYFCDGFVRDCNYQGRVMKACLSDSEDRRYDYITVDGEVDGRPRSCSREVDATSWTSGYYPCDYCVCTCDMSGSYDVYHGESKVINNYFSLNLVQSDFWNNKVITGVRLRVIDNIFQIQIQEGQLSFNDSQFRIDPLTVHWRNESQQHNKLEETPTTLLKLDWDFRGICLDDIQLPENQVIVGLKFVRGQSRVGNNDCVRLAVQYATIQRQPNYEIEIINWFNARDEVATRSPLKFEVADIPIDYSDHELDFRKNLFVNFNTSDFKKDAGQSVVPFFDIQPVVSATPAPLSGIGLIHKGRRDSSGYISFKITTFDLTDDLKAPQVS